MLSSATVIIEVDYNYKRCIHIIIQQSASKITTKVKGGGHVHEIIILNLVIASVNVCTARHSSQCHLRVLGPPLSTGEVGLANFAHPLASVDLKQCRRLECLLKWQLWGVAVEEQC